MSDLALQSATPDPERRTWLAVTGAAAGAAAVTAVIPFASSLAPSERARAMGAPVEVDIADIPPGGMKTVEWRGKPVWIVRRTPQMLAALEGHDADLADPGSVHDTIPDALRTPARSIRPEVFVAVGICTHLGCSPVEVQAGSAHPGLSAGWPGGFFCPCHGSTFDGSGRVYRNKPAPTNLEVPPHRYGDATRIIIGEEDVG